jgi:5-oxoprolinase (ATP-hydrolysing) subunit A
VVVTFEINCDMGESFGLYKMGDDAGIMPFITACNAACGFHASDPNHMRETVLLAKNHGVKVGAHPSLPDLVGFGRREMKISRDELANAIIYQVGALKAFLDAEGLPLNHIKPHGALYGMAARDEVMAHAICDAADVFKVPIYGLANTVHEKVYLGRGHKFVAEFFADLEYDGDGRLIITREHATVNPEWAAKRTVRVVKEGKVATTGGIDFPVRAETVCVHSDTPNSVEIARKVEEALSAMV